MRKGTIKHNLLEKSTLLISATRGRNLGRDPLETHSESCDLTTAMG